MERVSQYFSTFFSSTSETAIQKQETTNRQEYFINPHNKLVKAGAWLLAFMSMFEVTESIPVNRWSGLVEDLPSSSFSNCRDKPVGKTEGFICAHDVDGEGDFDGDYLVKPAEEAPKDPRKCLNSKQGLNNFLYAKNELNMNVPQVKIANIRNKSNLNRANSLSGMYFMSKFEHQYISASKLVEKARQECQVVGYTLEDRMKVRNWMVSYIGGEAVLARLLVSELLFGDLVSADNWGVVGNLVTLIDVDYPMKTLINFLYNAYGINSAAAGNAAMPISLETLYEMEEVFDELIANEQTLGQEALHEFLVLPKTEFIRLLRDLKSVAVNTIKKFEKTTHSSQQIACYMQEQHLKLFKEYQRSHPHDKLNSMDSMMLNYKIEFNEKNCK